MVIRLSTWHEIFTGQQQHVSCFINDCLLSPLGLHFMSPPSIPPRVFFVGYLYEHWQPEVCKLMRRSALLQNWIYRIYGSLWWSTIFCLIFLSYNCISQGQISLFGYFIYNQFLNLIYRKYKYMKHSYINHDRNYNHQTKKGFKSEEKYITVPPSMFEWHVMSWRCGADTPNQYKHVSH